MKLSDLIRGERAIVVPIGSSELNITYRMSERTPAALRIDTIDDPWLARAIAVWDLTDDEGEALPIDAETLATVPRPVLGRIIEAILGDDGGLGEADASSNAG